MLEIGTSGLMSGNGKRGVAAWPKPPRPSSTLPANIDGRQGVREAAMRHFRSMVPLVTELRASVAMFKRGPGH